ncbi:MAG: SDR family oxidoreductase [Ardenticatenaceae bacterium]|nr:SDR family oxidoreductase [Ardenticatenaceae bacterium]
MILVTGATGNVGREIVKLLFAEGTAVRAAVVSRQDVPKLPVPVPWEIFDFTNPATYEAAFAGVEKLFLMRPPHIANIQRDMKPVLDYAAKVGVKQIVFLSLVGAEKNKVVPHAKVEKLLMAGGVPYTLLRCGFFMQNLSTTHQQDIRDNHDIFIPAGGGKTAFIDVRDIAAVAAKVLTEAGHEQQAYVLTGSEALDYYEVAARMQKVLQRPIHYSRPSLFRFAWRLWRRGYPLAYVSVVTGIYLTTRWGLAERVTPEVMGLLGRSPILFEQFVEDYAAVWQTT